MAVLWAVEHFRPYLWGRKFALITWLFKSQNASPKLPRWALRRMEYDMELQWKVGLNHHLPDVLSRLQHFEAPGEDIDDSFPGEASDRQAYRGANGTVLDGVLLSEKGSDGTDIPPPRKRGGRGRSYLHPEHVVGSRHGSRTGPHGAAVGIGETNRRVPRMRGRGAAS